MKDEDKKLVVSDAGGMKVINKPADSLTAEELKQIPDGGIFLVNTHIREDKKELVTCGNDLPSKVLRALQEGKTREELARELEQLNLSLTVIGALLNHDGMGKFGEGFDNKKQGTEFFHRKAKKLLGKG